MSLKLSFLAASDGQPLTKTFTRPQKSQPIQKSNYPLVSRFDSFSVEVDSLKQMNDHLRYRAARGWCLLKGELLNNLKNESRAGTTSPDTPTEWLCLDFDGLTGVTTPDEALNLLGIEQTSYIVQYSASMGIINDSFNAHIFLRLSEPALPATIKTWLRHLNLTTPDLRSQLQLTRSHNALRWPLDVTVNQNDKLLYIAPPEVFDGIKDPYKNKRIKLRSLKGWRETLDVARFKEADLPKVEKEQLVCLNELRENLGLPRKRQINTKTYQGQTVGSAPTVASVTGVKEDRGFVYVNLNGGDSWGYYFPMANPEILFNFKGEDNYALKEIAPELYAEYQEKAAAYRQEVSERKLQQQETGRAYLGFLDPVTDSYFRGYYDFDTDSLNVHRTNSLVKVQHFLKQHGQPVGDFIPEWNYEFNFASDVVFDPENKVLNRFQRSKYLREPKRGATPTIDRILDHVTGSDEAATDRLINWIAYILQYRKPAQTAWLLHGIQGTGKGVLFNHILTPLVGEQYVQVKRLDEIEDDFNGYMQDCVFLLIDEIQISDAKHRSRAMSKLKNMIPEPKISVRAMRSDFIMVKNNSNIIFASNKPDPVEIDPTDRRINVANYQDDRLFLTHTDIQNVHNELHAFAHKLLTYEVREADAIQPMDSAAKRHIQYLTRNSIDLFSDALREGALQYFFESMPTQSSATKVELDLVDSVKHQRYAQLIGSYFDAIAKSGQARTARVPIPRDDLRFLAEYLIGKVPDTPNKFTAFVKHHGIDIQPIKCEGRTVQGVYANFTASQELLDEWYAMWAKNDNPQPDSGKPSTRKPRATGKSTVVDIKRQKK